MATRTSSTSGNWSASVWGGAASPGVGDIAVIASGHTITVDTTIEVGDDVGTGITLVGSLIINNPLTIRGALAISQQRTSSVTISRVGSNTGSLTFNPNSAVTAHWDTPNTGSGTPVITITGEAGDLVPITTSLARSGNRAYFNFTAYPPTLDWDYGNFTDLGGTGDTATTRFLSYTGVGADSIQWNNCRFSSDIGKFHFALDSNNFTFDVQNCDFRASRLTDMWQINNSVAHVSGTRRFLSCTFHDTSVRNLLLWCNDWLFDECIFSDFNCIGDIQELNITWRNCVVFKDVAGGTLITGRGMSGALIEESIFITNSDNPHYVSFASGDAGGIVPRILTTVVDGCGFVGSDAGDFYLLNDFTISLDRVLAINRAGSVVSVLGTGGIVQKMIRCTLHGVGTFCNMGESASAATNLQRVSSCLFVSQPTGIFADVALTSQTGWTCDYNGFWEQTEATNVDHPTLPGTPNSYLENLTWWSSGAYGDDTKGLHDIHADPQFADSTVTSMKWIAEVNGGAASFANLRAEMLKLNGTAEDGTASAFDPDANRAALMLYLRQGFTPQNPIYFNAGAPADGSPSIGAVDAVPPAPPPQFTFPRRATFRKRAIGADD